jgi:hypothetical protein
VAYLATPSTKRDHHAIATKVKVYYNLHFEIVEYPVCLPWPISDSFPPSKGDIGARGSPWVRCFEDASVSYFPRFPGSTYQLYGRPAHAFCAVQDIPPHYTAIAIEIIGFL